MLIANVAPGRLQI